jgi:hypothetical protein
MKKLAIIIVLWLSILNTIAQKILLTKVGHIIFYSKAPLQNIDAHNDNVGIILNTSNNEIVFKVSIRNFEFKNPKMQEDFNEDYMETDKYPEASFDGKINEMIDFPKDGTYNVTATGRLKIHGVEKIVTQKGTVTIVNGKVSLHSEFHVLLKDYNIKIPKMVFQKIAEDILVTMDADLTP